MADKKVKNKTLRNLFKQTIRQNYDITLKGHHPEEEPDIEDELLDATEFVEGSFSLVQYGGEVYFMIPCIILAILLNSVALYYWKKNKFVLGSLKFFIMLLIVSDQLYLASLIPYLVFRPRSLDAMYFNGKFNFSAITYLNYSQSNYKITPLHIGSLSNKSVAGGNSEFKKLVDPFVFPVVDSFNNTNNNKTNNNLINKTNNINDDSDTIVIYYNLKDFIDNNKRKMQSVRNNGSTTKSFLSIVNNKNNNHNNNKYNNTFNSPILKSRLNNNKTFFEILSQVFNKTNLTLPSTTTKSPKVTNNPSPKNTPKNHTQVMESYFFVHYLASIVGTTQLTSAWLLYLTATEANTAVRKVVFGPDNLLLLTKCLPFVILLISSFYFSIFLPEVRGVFVEFVGLLYQNTKLNTTKVPPTFYHDVNLMPFQNHWDFVLNDVPSEDLLYIILFSLTYVTFTYVIPYCLLVGKDKNLIDALHASQKVELATLIERERLKKEKKEEDEKKEREEKERKEREERENNEEGMDETREDQVLVEVNRKSIKREERKSRRKSKYQTKKFAKRPVKQWHHYRLKPKEKAVISDLQAIRRSLLYASATVSATCNVYLVCVALKMVILTFKVFEYLHHYTSDSQVFFQYLNIYSNFIQMLKCTIHLPLMALYNVESRKAIIKRLPNVKAMKKKIQKYM